MKESAPEVLALKDIDDLVAGVDVLNASVEKLQAGNASLTSTNKALTKQNYSLTKCVSEMEQYSQINNLELKGILSSQG